MQKSLLILCGLLTLPSALFAATIKPDSNHIDAVTVFLDRAEITRQIDVSLKPGNHTVEVNRLPAQLLIDSLKVSASGSRGLRIVSVESRRQFGEQVAMEQERKLRERLQQLKDQQAGLEGELQALNTQAAFIERLAQLPGSEVDEGERRMEPEKWSTAWQAIGKGMAETNGARIKLKQQQRDLQQKIRKVEEELRQIQTGRRDTLNVLIHIEVANLGKARFTLGYQLHGATWVPDYDAQLTTSKGSIELLQRAQVSQSSGEAWNNVSLSVSTARPSAGAVMPELQPWWVDFVERIAKRARMYEADGFAGAPMPAPSMSEPMELEQKAKAETLVATTEASEFSVRYRIPGRMSVPPDGSPQRFVLARQQLDGKLSARATPRLDPRAFLYAEVDYQGETPLLAGEWQLQRDGVYVGKAYQKAVRPAESIALAFGPDEAIQVKHQLLKDERSKDGLLSRSTRVDRQYLISVENGHKRDIPVNIYDQLPVARDEAIEVKLNSTGSKPTEQDVDEKSGVLMWQRRLEAGATAKIEFGYSISFPQDKQVPGF